MVSGLTLILLEIFSLVLHIVAVIWSLSLVQLFTTSWTATHQASLSFIISQNLLKFMSFESVMPANHLILCHSLLLLPLIFHSIRVFSNGSALSVRWPKYWSFCFKISPFFFFKFYFIFKLYNIVLVLPNIEMNPPQVLMNIQG